MTEPTAVESDVAPLPDPEPEQSDNRPRPEDGPQLPAELAAQPVELPDDLKVPE